MTHSYKLNLNTLEKRIESKLEHSISPDNIVNYLLISHNLVLCISDCGHGSGLQNRVSFQLMEAYTGHGMDLIVHTLLKNNNLVTLLRRPYER